MSSSTSSFRIDVQSAPAKALQSSLQTALAQKGYSTADDPVMAEYIVVMLANQKSQQQITAELQDLIGPEYEEAFTAWLWDQADRHINGNRDLPPISEEQQPSDVQPEAGPSTLASEGGEDEQMGSGSRRSRSPVQPRGGRETRRSVSPETQRRLARGDSWRRDDLGPSQRTSRGWSEEGNGGAMGTHGGEPTGRSFWQQMPRTQQRAPRELFGTAMAQATRGGFQQPQQTGRWQRGVRNAGTHDDGNAQGGFQSRPLAMDDPSLVPTTIQPTFGMRIQGVSRQDVPIQGPPPSSSSLSIFGRAGVPDPRAAEFVPGRLANSSPAEPGFIASNSNHDTTNINTYSNSSNGSASIFSRIDPMIPNNQLPPSAAAAAAEGGEAAGSSSLRGVHPTDYPSAPTETSLCRWNLGCTNPMCPYSHASPANAGKGGDENALVLSQEACRFASGCTNRDCTRSHISPSVAFIDRKTAAAVSSIFAPSAHRTGTNDGRGTFGGVVHGQQPCRFQMACTNPACTYTHFEDGKLVPSPALRALASSSGATSSSSNIGPAHGDRGGAIADSSMSDGSVDLQTEATTTTTTANAAEADTAAATADKTAPSGLDKALGEGDRGAKKCKFGVACTRADCFFAHPPGRRLGGGSSGGSVASGPTPCRFGLGCTRANCYFAHPPGRTLSAINGGSLSSADHISDRLSRFAQQSTEEMETIIPGQS